MNKLCRKLQSQAGDTLMEILAALILVILSITVFSTTLTLASRINRQQADRQQALYDDAAQAENGAGDTQNGTLTIRGDLTGIPDQTIIVSGESVKAYRGR